MKETIINVKNKLEEIKENLNSLENILNESITFDDICFQKENLDKINSSIDKQLDIIESKIISNLY